MRFYLDEDLSGEVARIGRAQGVDVISSHECGRNGLPDDEQLRLAAADGRCLVTRNAKDFLPLTAEFFEEGRPHPGMLIVASSLPNHDFAAIAAALVAYARRFEGDLPSYTTDFLTPAERP